MSITDKKQAILDTALNLFVTQGFHATTTAAIARQADVATGTLFHHFASKDALLQHLFLSIKQEFADAIIASSDSSEDLEAAAKNLWFCALDWAIANPLKQAFFQLYSMSPTIDLATRSQAMNTILSFIAALINKGQQQGIIANYPMGLMQDNCHGQYLAATRYFIDNPQNWQLTDHREASFSLFWNAMLAS
jgi:AcrR family transcriptional regulator